MPRHLARLALAALLLAAAPAAAQGIRLDNYADGETLRYPVPLLRGTLADKAATAVTVVNQSSDRPTKELKGIASRGRFKALAELVPGPNRLVVRAGRQELAVTLTYKPQTNPYVLQVVYMTDRGGDTKYQTPRPRDPQNYEAKIDTAMKLLQGFTAERMNELGYGRATFNLELDDKGKVKIHTRKSDKPADFYYNLEQVPLYAAAGAWADAEFPSPKAKKVVIAAFTRFDPRTRKALGHTALGGGSTALFGSGSLWAWPDSLGGVFPAFRDTTPVDGRRVLDDSAGRSTVWGLCATTIPVELHELMHAWDLPHSAERFDVMARGFDYFNRYYTFVDPPSRANPRPAAFSEDQVSTITPVSGAALRPSRWFALDDRPWKDGDRPKVTAAGGGDFLVEAPHGLAYLGFDVKDDSGDTKAVNYKSWGEGKDKTCPKSYRLTAAKPRRLAGSADVRLLAVDAEGQLTQAETAKLAKP